MSATHIYPAPDRCGGVSSVLELTADSLRSSFCVHICRWHAVFVGESQQQDHCALPSRATRRCQWLTVWQQIEPIGTSSFSYSSPSCNASTARARVCRRLGQPSCVRLPCSVTDELRLSGGLRVVTHDLQRVPDGKRQWKRSRGAQREQELPSCRSGVHFMAIT